MVSLTADMSPLHPDRNLALELVRATEAAALHFGPSLVGKTKSAHATCAIAEIAP